MSERAAAYPVDVQRCLDRLAEMIASAPRPTLCESCSRVGQPKCPDCQNIDLVCQCVEMMQHTSAILRSYVPSSLPPVRGEQETGKKRCVGCGLWNECDECPSAVSIGKVKSQHGKDCPKVLHVGGGYLHDPDDDGIYDVDGVTYCGRCHGWMGSAPVRAEAAKTLGEDKP